MAADEGKELAGGYIVSTYYNMLFSIITSFYFLFRIISYFANNQHLGKTINKLLFLLYYYLGKPIILAL